MFDKKIVLASKSPRRSQLLQEAGFDFEVRTCEVEEEYPADLPVEDVAAYLARKKARESKHLLQNEQEILIAADSIVVMGDTIYGKPKDYEDACRTLKTLSDNSHQVITGVCILNHEKIQSFSSVSKVFMSPLSHEEIEYYIKTFEPYDKAGSYAIQEWIGLCKISRIEGTFSNIMGLPVEKLYRELMRF
ncbi:MAG: Maf family protein [Saprospiraceae bacterium]